ncbi:MAG: IS110 family transposase [Firmicutes bacterium]|nr:IS110 family transposase [Bacillota bacterium]
MKIVYPICAGLDVHKKEIVATIAITNSQNVTTYKLRKFPTFTSDLNALADWLLSHDCRLVCMESTGKYYIPVYRVLEQRGLKPYVAHPKFLRSIPGKKTDPKDSKWIADLFKHGLVPTSYVPSRDIFELRDLTRYYAKLTNIRTGEKNRIQNSLTVSNIMLSSVVSDTFGKAASAILRYVLDHPNEKDIDFSQFMTKNLHATPAEFAKAMDGAFSPEQADKTKVALSHFDYINSCLTQLDSAISVLARRYRPQIELLVTHPAVTHHSAVRILAEIGDDMSVFPDSKHFCSWAGLAPQCNESGGKKKSIHISHGGMYLKPVLVQVALAAVKDKSNPYYAYKYQALSKRRGKQRAIIAIARMILTSIYHMLSQNVPYSTDLYQSYHHKQTAKSIRLSMPKIFAFLSSKGLSVVNNDGVVLNPTG